MRKLRAAVVGTGLIGGSILTQLHHKGVDVVGWDPDGETRSFGAKAGLAFAGDLEEAVANRDVVFLAGPLGSIPAGLRQAAGNVAPECVITDVGSTKQHISRIAEENGLAAGFVPGHPMAGTERSGLAAADPALFDGASWVLCPYPHESLAGFRRLAAILIGVFGVQVVPMDPVAHDATVALSSHIPHLLAGALAGGVGRSPLRSSVLGLAAGSFRDGTRVAGTLSARISDMLVSNRDAVLSQLGLVRGFLDDLTDALAKRDDSHLKEQLARARDIRVALLRREMIEAHVVFQVGAPADEEHRFLMGLGAAGGYLAGCEVVDDQVRYRYLMPPYLGEPEM